MIYAVVLLTVQLGSVLFRFTEVFLSKSTVCGPPFTTRGELDVTLIPGEGGVVDGFVFRTVTLVVVGRGARGVSRDGLAAVSEDKNQVGTTVALIMRESLTVSMICCTPSRNSSIGRG